MCRAASCFRLSSRESPMVGSASKKLCIFSSSPGVASCPCPCPCPRPLRCATGERHSNHSRVSLPVRHCLTHTARKAGPFQHAARCSRCNLMDAAPPPAAEPPPAPHRPATVTEVSSPRLLGTPPPNASARVITRTPRSGRHLSRLLLRQPRHRPAYSASPASAELLSLSGRKPQICLLPVSRAVNWKESENHPKIWERLHRDFLPPCRCPRCRAAGAGTSSKCYWARCCWSCALHFRVLRLAIPRLYGLVGGGRSERDPQEGRAVASGIGRVCDCAGGSGRIRR